MNGVAPAAAATASAAPTAGLSRPPLPHRPRGSCRSLKQREREAPEVDWDHSLQHFAAAVGDDLDELHSRFLEQDVVTFAAWKRLWRDARMSAAFHAEFWESTPTNTHKAIMQQTLDGLVACIRERNGEFERAADVAALIGRVFALYCAHSVQLSSPKHKIDVDPQAWTALLTINYVVCGVGASLLPSAAREARAMMHRLVVKESAFLRCLKGFGPSISLKDRAVGTPSAAETGARQVLMPVTDTASKDDAPVKQSKVEQLKLLNERYQDLMSRNRSAGSGSGARVGGRRGKPAASVSLVPGSLPQEAGNDGQDLTRALTSYMEFKGNEEARRCDRAARAAAAREHESRTFLEMNAMERDDTSNILDLSDRGSVVSVSPSPMTIRSFASSQHGSHRRRDSDASDAFLAELESELHADISTDQHRPTTVHLASYNEPAGHRHNQSSAVSEISEADSDALADLERELEQSVDAMSSETRKEATPANTSPPARRKRGRPPATGIVSRTVPRSSQTSMQKPVNTSRVKSARPAAKRARSESVASRLSFADSWAASSTADSDGLAAIQAELDAVPTQEGPNIETQHCISGATSSTVRVPDEKVQAIPKTKSKAKPKPKAKQRGRQSTGCASERRNTSAIVIDRDRQNHPSVPTAQATEGRLRALSVVSDSSELITELQAELDFASGPLAKATRNLPASARRSTADSRMRPRRSSRLSSVASEADSDALDKLEKELNATAAILETVPPPAVTAPTKTTSQQRRRWTRLSSVASDADSNAFEELEKELNATPATVEAIVAAIAVNNKTKTAPRRAAAKRPAQRPPRRTAKKQRPIEEKTSAATDVHQPLASQRFFEAGGKQHASTFDPVPRQESSRMSSIVSDTESDGLAELVAELGTTATIQTSTASQQNQTPPNKAASSTRPRARRKSPLPKVVASHPAPARSKPQTLPPPPAAVTTAPNARPRRSTRLSSLASDTESDGLEDLMAELESKPTSAMASKPPVAITKKLRARGETTRKQPARAEATKSKQSKAAQESKAKFPAPTRKPRAPRQAQEKPKRTAPQKVAAKASTRQSSAAPVNVPSSQRSTRSSSEAFDTDSDGLAELEAELQQSLLGRTATSIKWSMGKAGDVEEEASADLAWRVELLRALITGDLPNVERVILAHIEVISAPFTAAMPPWTLQWEGMHWWMLQNATPLFVASAYSRPGIVHWLLMNGADRSAPCYLKQTPGQVVGECCAHAALSDRNRDTKSIVADSATCMRLLEETPMPPLPPTSDVAFSSSYSSEVVITRSGSFTASSIQQIVYKCLLRVSWQTPLSSGAIIDKYELRYRRLIMDEENEVGTDQDEDKKGKIAVVDSTSVTWRSERVAHNRKSRQQGAQIEGLQFNTLYEFMLRSWNAAGNGEWSPSLQTKTPAVPTRSVGAR